MATTFTLFSSLPLELRDQIWRSTLPDNVDGPAFCFYKKGYWRPRYVLESEEDYDPGDDGMDLRLEFRHDLCDDIRYEIPQLFVNSEARRVALAYFRTHNNIRPCKNQYFTFVRPLDPSKDALYISLDKWNDFLREPYDRMDEPDLIEKLIASGADLRCIALPDELFRSEGPKALSEMLEWFIGLQVLFIVFDEQPDPGLQSACHNMRVQRWEFKNTEGGAFFWNNDRGVFEFIGEGRGIFLE